MARYPFLHQFLFVAATTLVSSPCLPAQNPASASSAHPSSQQDIAAAIRLMQNREFQAAVVQLSKVVRADPASADALVWRGICENQLRQFSAAEQDFKAALHLRPDALPAHYNYALTLIRLNRPEEARTEFERVIKADPTATLARYNLAILLEEKQDLAGAIDQLDQAWKLDSSDVGIGEHLLLDELTVGRSSDADTVAQQLLKLEAQPELQQHTGSALAAAGYPREALLFLESAQQHGQPSRESNLLLARTYIAAQQSFTAIRLLKGNEQSDRSGETAYLLGLAYASAGATEEAKSAFGVCHNVQPQDGRCLFQLALLHAKGGKPEQAQAMSELRAALRLEPRNPTYAIALARLMLQANDPKGALALLNPLHAPATLEAQRLLLLGIAQAATIGPTSAEATVRRAVDLDPSIALSHDILGFCYFSQGGYSNAAASYRRASDLQPTIGNFAYSAGLAYERAGDTANAITYAQRAASQAGATADAHLLLGKLYLGAQRTNDGIAELETAIHINPDLESPYYLLARTYMQQGETAKAQEMSDHLSALKQAHDPSHAAGGSQAMSNSSSSGASLLLEGKTAIGAEPVQDVPNKLP